MSFSKIITITGVFLASASLVAGHGFVQNIVIDGKRYLTTYLTIWCHLQERAHTQAAKERKIKKRKESWQKFNKLWRVHREPISIHVRSSRGRRLVLPPTATDLGFVDGTGYQGPDIICHRGAKPAAALTASAAARRNRQAGMELRWPDSHHGPVIDHLAPCDGDCFRRGQDPIEILQNPPNSPPGIWAWKTIW